MKGKHARRATLRKKTAAQEQEQQRRVEAAAVAETLQGVRSAEESVAEFAHDLYLQMSARETADALEVDRLTREAESLLLEAAALEGAVKAADLCWKRWFAIFKDDLARSMVLNAKPRYLPASRKQGVCTDAAMKAMEDWGGYKRELWKDRFMDRKKSMVRAPRAWEGLAAEAES